MEDINDSIQALFEEYEKQVREGLAGEAAAADTARLFGEFFVEASPVGIKGGKNDATFLDEVPRGYEFYRSAGITNMEIRQLDITELDDLHYLVEVRWESFYQKNGTENSVEFNVIYFVQNQKGTLKIFAYITGDERAVLKERGLV